MKKTMKILAIITVLCAAFAISAFAADFEHCADSLNELGLFKGTQKGYELDRAPTRAEAATMLVRLLGAEEEALELTYTAPYTDVADWAKPYVQYLHNSGLTKGTSAQTFGYSDTCTAQQYATFLLRSLGYSDSEGGDFTYAEAMNFARELGVVDDYNCREDAFLRDHVAAMSYTALSCAPKSGEADLLTKLVDSGAISDAKGYDETFKKLRLLSEEAVACDSAAKASMDMDMKIAMNIDGADYMVTEITFSAAADVNEENVNSSRISYSGKMKAKIGDAFADAMGISETERESTTEVKYFYADGYIYIDLGDEKVKMPMTFSEVEERISVPDAVPESFPLSAIKDISEKKGTDGSETYSIEYAPSVINSAMEAKVTEGDEASNYNKIKVEYVLAGGKISSIGVYVETSNTDDSHEVKTIMEVTARNMKYGESITITTPSDLDEYVEISE